MIEIVAALAILPVSSQNQAPEVTFKVNNVAGQAGTLQTGLVTITFAPGLHGYQNPPSEDYMIPVSISGSSLENFKVKYPVGTPAAVGGETKLVMTYEGTVEFPVIFRVPTKPGKFEPEISVRYQLCNDQACFAPGNVKAKTTFSIEKRNGFVSSVKSATQDLIILQKFMGNAK